MNTQEPYQLYLDEILQDLKKLESSQIATSKAEYDLTQGYGFLQGKPYSIIILGGDEFLFGFAFKPKFDFKEYDVNDLIKLVRWSLN